jgi:hypothetical protein
MSDLFGADPSAPGVVRAPRLRVLANGVAVAGATDAEVVNNNHLAADRFYTSIALNADPSGAFELIASPEILVDVQVSLDGGMSFTSLIQGNVDSLSMDPVCGTVELEGRDLSRALIETHTQETFANQTSSEIATMLAGRHGLDADVQATTTPVGRYWQLDHDRIVLNQFGRITTEWDLLATLAQHEGFDVYVTGATLHFRAPVDDPAPSAVLRPAATVNGPANVASLRLDRSLLLASDVQVTVRSWNSRQGSGCMQTAKHAGSGVAGGMAQTYAYVVPNLMPDDALRLAQNRLAELTLHERVLTAEMPGELVLAPRMMLRLEGTGTDFDQSYWVDRIERRISMQYGFSQILSAKNTSMTGEASAPGEPASSVWTGS